MATNERISKTNVLRLWAPNYPEVERWLTKIQQKEGSAHSFYRFCEYVKKTPTELLALKEKDMTTNPPQNVIEKMLDSFCGDLEADFTNAERFNIAISVKSFFKWNYRELARASGIVNLEKVKDYNPLTKDILRKIYDRARNPRDRALVIFVTSTGIAKETLSKLKWSHLEENWQNVQLPCVQIGSESLKGHGVSKYKGVQQITFLTPEAKRELINYKEWIEQKIGRRLLSNDNVWFGIVEPFEPLSYTALGGLAIRLGKETGVKFSLHDGRRWINTALEQIGISQNWARKIRGRKVKGEEAPYSRPAIEQLRAKFAEAVRYLEFTSADTTAEDRLKKVEELTKSLSEEQKKAFGDLGFQLRSKGKKQPEKCENGKNCQKIVDEVDLGDLLADGWRVVSSLPSGKIVVSNEA
jgi:integrase